MQASTAGLSAEDERRMMAVLQELQIQDSMRLYNELVYLCFNNCVDSFRSSKLEAKEEACVTKCAQKFLKLAARAGQRFAEQQQQFLGGGSDGGAGGSSSSSDGSALSR
jgi:import inner membrane translocase subunit TIM9